MNHSVISALLWACLTVSSPARAAFVPAEILDNEAAFAQFSSDWRFECDDADILNTDPQIDDHLRTFFLDTIRDGLRRLHRINPKLVEDSLIWAQQGRHNLLAIGCVRQAGSVASYIPPQSNFDLGRFNVGNVAYSLAASNNPDVISKLGRNPMVRDRDFFRMAIFHEYLHALEVGNNPDYDHDEKIFQYFEGTQRDVVYACTAQVFPEAGFTLAVRLDGTKYLNTRLACDTCARARRTNSSIIIDDSRESDEWAFSVCFNIPDDGVQTE